MVVGNKSPKTVKIQIIVMECLLALRSFIGGSELGEKHMYRILTAR
jgi:hypothetical protein